MDSRKIISREPLFEIILLNIEREQRACFFFFEMLDFKNRNIGGKEKENGLRKNFNVVRLCYFFTDVKKKRIIIEWLLADREEIQFFYKRQEKKSTREENEDRSTPLLFFSFFSFFHPTNRSSHPRREGNIFPIRVELEPLFIDEKIPREASVDKRRDSFLLKGGHNGTADKSSRN